MPAIPKRLRSHAKGPVLPHPDRGGPRIASFSSDFLLDNPIVRDGLAGRHRSSDLACRGCSIIPQYPFDGGADRQHCATAPKTGIGEAPDRVPGMPATRRAWTFGQIPKSNGRPPRQGAHAPGVPTSSVTRRQSPSSPTGRRPMKGKRILRNRQRSGRLRPPERLLWMPGKLISIPQPVPLFAPRVIFFQNDGPYTVYLARRYDAPFALRPGCRLTRKDCC